MSDEVESIAETAISSNVGVFYFAYEGIERAGLIVCHADQYGNFCTTVLGFESMRSKIGPERPLWRVETFEPLTIMPSVVCRACGLHGYIREGKWFPIP